MNVKIGDRNFRGDVSLFTDDHFLSVFDFKLVAGNRKSLLNSPYTAVLTERTARKFFAFDGNDMPDLIGKTFFWGLDPHPYEVKGILADIPSNSHLQFDALVSYATLLTESKDADISWTWSDMRHYLLLKPGVDRKALEAKFPAFSDRYFQGNKVSGSVEKFYLQPMKEAHLYSDYEYDIATTASGRAVWAMLIVGVFILVIAWINYINLTTSRAIERAREVGLRKVMGAFRSQLIGQFILESLLITAAAAIIAVLLITLLQPSFNQIVGTNLTWQLLLNEVTTNQILIVIGGLIAGAVIAGFYPALTLSGYQPVTVLKGKFARSGAGNVFRKALVIFQFAASAALITCTLVVARQLDFMNSADLGFNMQNVLLVRSPELVEWDSTIINKVETFKNELKEVSGVANATTSWGVPGDRLGRSFDIRIEGQPAELHYTLSHTGVDHDFFKTMGIRLIAGREFLPTDHNIDFGKLNTIILNKKAVELFGFSSPAEAIGHEVLWGNDGTRKWTIIGVVGDHHQEGLQKPMEAMLYRPAYSTYSSIMIKLEKTANTEQILPRIETLYRKFFVGNSFEYSYLAEKYNTQYNDEKRFSKVISIFTGLAIIVACLGLIGLSSYTALQRTKEIGVRKVLGASVTNIVSILSIDFIRLVIIAAILSLPVAYYSMSEWLQTYTYRISLSWTLFLIPLLLVIIIAVVTIFAQVLKAALAKPVDTLKYE